MLGAASLGPLFFASVNAVVLSIMSLVSVAEAEQIVLSNTRTWGIEHIPFEAAIGRVLAEDIVADREFPPYHRVTMDGIAIRYAAFAAGTRTFRVRATMAAGNVPVEIDADDECIEIMTGCALPTSTDTIVRYEDVAIKNDCAAIVCNELRQGANIHRAGSDKQKGSVVVSKGAVVDAAIINMAASVGAVSIAAYKLPRVAIISTGDELVPVAQMPSPYQVRISNSYAIKAVLHPFGIQAQMFHINDDEQAVEQLIHKCITECDVVILSGGVSMGKYDYVPQALERSGVTKLFHKVRQRPGKPFWFGTHSGNGAVVFAFPGNPVSAFMCAQRYLIPWLQASLQYASTTSLFAALSADITFTPQLQYFLQVYVRVNNLGQLVATPIESNGSGDFSVLTEANAFMELPAEINNFAKGEAHRIWPFKTIL
jgi:molybdopterin molybdotransferase